MIVYIENLKEPTRKPPGTIISRDYSKVSGFKVNIQKSIALLCTINEQLEFEIKNTIPFTLAPNNQILRYAGMLNCFSHVRLLATLWTIARQTPLCMGFSSKNTGAGCNALLQGIFPTQGSNPQLSCLLPLQVGSLPLARPCMYKSNQKNNISMTKTTKLKISKIY